MQWIDADTAVKRLGISKATLYAYVSRGMVTSRGTKESRKRMYSEDDIEALLLRRTRKDPTYVAKEALDWGIPVLDSAITLVRDGRLYYRGYDACELATSSSIEQVAALLWSGAMTRPITSNQVRCPIDLPPNMDAAGKLMTACVALEAEDPGAWGFDADPIRAVGERMLSAFVSLLAPDTDGSIADRLAQAWGLRPPTRG